LDACDFRRHALLQEHDGATTSVGRVPMMAPPLAWAGCEVGDGVTVVNRLTTTRIPWAEVERFGYDGALWVRRRDMRQHNVAAFSFVPGSLPGASERGREAAVRLENVRKKRRGRGGGKDR
jgi:hypothetical protein